MSLNTYLQTYFSYNSLYVDTSVEKGRSVLTDKNIFPGEVIIESDNIGLYTFVNNCAYCSANLFVDVHSHLNSCFGFKIETSLVCSSLFRECTEHDYQLLVFIIAYILDLEHSSSLNDKQSLLELFFALEGQLLLNKSLMDKAIMYSIKIEKQLATDKANKLTQFKVSELHENKMVNFVYTALCIFKNNNFNITNSEFVSIGGGTFPLLSLVNHSCTYNSIASYHRGKMKLISIEQITKGEEICIGYIDVIYNVDVRQNTLSNKYNFKCTCDKCKGVVSTGLSKLWDGLSDIHLEFGKHNNNINMSALSQICTSFVEEQGYDESLMCSCILKTCNLFNISSTQFKDLTETYIYNMNALNWKNSFYYGLVIYAVYKAAYPRYSPLLIIHLVDHVKCAWNYFVSELEPPLFMDVLIQFFFNTLDQCMKVCAVIFKRSVVYQDYEFLKKNID